MKHQKHNYVSYKKHKTWRIFVSFQVVTLYNIIRRNVRVVTVSVIKENIVRIEYDSIIKNEFAE